MSNDKLMQLMMGPGISNFAHDRSQLEKNHDASTPLIEYHNLNDINHMKQIAEAYKNEEVNKEIHNICVSTLYHCIDTHQEYLKQTRPPK